MLFRGAVKGTSRRRLLAGPLLVIAVATLLACPAVLSSEHDIDWRVIEWDDSERAYGVYVPDLPMSPAPVVFLLHGGGGSAGTTWAQEHGRSWRALADEHGFVLVLPQGRSDPDDAEAHHWNDCRTDVRSEAANTSEDDMGFIVHLIDIVSGDAAIDVEQVFVTGASNGGMMTFRLALEASERFAAAAAVIANMPDPSECGSSADPIPMLIMNGTDDPLIPHDGGCVAGSRCDRGRVMSTPETVAFWVESNGASTEPAVEKLRNRAWFDGSTVTVYTFVGEDEGADVVYYHIDGGGHTVPGYEKTSAVRRAVSGSKNRDIDGPAEIWAFFLAQISAELEG